MCELILSLSLIVSVYEQINTVYCMGEPATRVSHT